MSIMADRRPSPRWLSSLLRRATPRGLAPFVATIEIQVSEPDAKVYLDDEPVPAGEWNGPRPSFLDVGFG